jgi:hypothetical protein
MSELKPIGDQWQEQRILLASDGENRKYKRLFLSVRFDGNGNNVTRFVLQQHATMDINFEKCDAAIRRYNDTAPRKP